MSGIYRNTGIPIGRKTMNGLGCLLFIFICLPSTPPVLGIFRYCRKITLAFLCVGGSDTDSDEYNDAVKMERRDKRRFARADKDNDGLLDKVEFQLFIHPEESREMKDLVIDVS